MASVTRDKKKIVSAGEGIRSTANQRRTTIKEDDAEYYQHHDPRRNDDQYFYNGRLKPLLDE